MLRCVASIAYSTAGASAPAAAALVECEVSGFEDMEIAPCLRWRAASGARDGVARSAPAQRHADVARYPAGEVDDLHLEPVSARTQVSVPERVELLRLPGQRFLPPDLGLIDRPAAIRAKLIGKAQHEDFGLAVPHRAVDDRGGAP